MACMDDNGRGLSAEDQELLKAFARLPARDFRAAARLLRSILAYGRVVERLKRDAARCHNFDVAALLAA
ncbi:MAG TPA: hypothetical protein PKZ99_15680, partial [Azospirillaceae bacterium]|nr:hypothetical protein [Azospirillaceae bacterium]